MPVSELLDLVPVDTTSDAVPGDTASAGEVGRYRVRGELGRGGMGAVLRAFDRDVRREVAIKVMLPGRADRVALARFLTEGQVTGQLEHPNIVPVHELGLDSEGRMFIAMRLVHGRSLQRVVRDAAAGRDPFPLSARLDVFRKVCDAVAYAHSRGVIHRDLKPDNIMVGRFGEVQVMDWGLARLLTRGQDDDGHSGSDRSGATTRPAPKDLVAGAVEVDDDGVARTLDGQIVGTPAYMPPEQVEGDRDAIDERADIYALGAVLYELLTLTPPYRRMTPVQIFAAIWRGELDPPSSRARVPRDLEAIVLRAMAHEPGRRYASVPELRADVDAWLAHEPVRARRAGPLERLARAVRRRPHVALSAVFLLVIGVVAAVAWAALAAADAEQQRLAHSQREAQLARLLAEGRLDELGDELAVEQLAHTRSVTARDFEAQLDLAHRQGISDDDFIDGIPPDQRDAAIAAFEEFIATCDRVGRVEYTADDCFYLAVLYGLGRDDNETAFRWLDRAAQLDADHARSRNLRGHLLRSLGRTEEALAVFAQLARDAPQFYPGLRGHGQVLMDLGRYREAIDAFDDAIACTPDRPAAWNDRAMCHVRLGEYDDALADATESLRRFPANVHALNTLGAAQMALGDVDAARATADRMMATSPDHVRSLCMRSAVRRASGDAAGALADARAATQIAPGDATAWVDLGLAHAMAGRQAEAIAAYSRALSVDRMLFEAWFDRGIARINSGQHDEAIADLTRAIELDDDDARPWSSRGAARAMSGDFEGGRSDVRAALDRDPTMWSAWKNLAGIEQRLGNDDAVVPALQQAWRHCLDPAARTRLAEQLRALGHDPR